ncbi:PQQ-dependent sugar dehydrogenase [Marinobacteraceae bacterium S3BR75-40.1]
MTPINPFVAIMVAALTLLLSTAAGGAPTLRVEQIAEGLEHPWSLVFLPNGNALVSERAGRLRLLKDGKLDPDPVEGVPAVAAVGQGGLLDLALHPDFAHNHWLYFSYAHRGEDGLTTRLARAQYRDGVLKDREVLFEALPREPTRHHFGGRIVFDREGHVYLSVGDRGTKSNAQNLTHHAGSIIRLNADGSVPADNPFVNRSDARPEIFAYGVRNPQGMALHPDTGAVWEHEHGPRGGDEVNIIRKGVNYGWPKITYGIDYDGSIISEKTHAPGMAQPLHYWDPSIAPSGMAFYSGDAFPQWQGDVFVGALAGQKLVRLRFEGEKLREEEALLEDLHSRIRAVIDAPDGTLWLLTDAANGQILRLTSP